MKKKNYFGLVLAAVAFAACNNDDMILAEGNDGGATDSGEDAWVALSVQSTSKIRGLNNPDTNNGTADESTITAVKAIFFDGHLDASAVTKVVDFGTDDINNLPNRTQAFKVPSKSKSVLIIANPQNMPSLTLTDYQSVNSVVENITDVTSNVAKSGEFLMTNAKGGLEPSDASGGPADLVLHKNAAAAEGSPLTVRIDRVPAKVRVILDKTGNDLSDKATINGTEWFLNVTNKKYFPASERIRTILNTTTPFDQYGLGSYRIDPNYSSMNIGTWNTGNYDDNYNYVTSASSSIAWGVVGIDNPKYCLENTQEEDYNVQAYTTQALLKVNYAPNNVKDVDGNLVTVGSGTDWFIMNGAFYTPASILTYIKKELKNKFMHNKPAEFLTPITDGYNDYIEALGLTPVDIPTLDQQEESAAESQAETLVTRFSGLATNISDKSKGGKNLKGVSYYYGGLCYYKIMVKHDNKDTDDFMNRFGEFGVVRNSVYDIHISKINNPGYPSIPDPDPNTPNEENDQYLSIKIEVNPWTWYTQTEEL